MRQQPHWYAYPIMIIALLTGLSAGAQTGDTPDTPDNDDGFISLFDLIEKGDTTLYYADVISDTTLPCNLEEERFGDFMSRFQSDKDFRLSRLDKSILAAMQEGTDQYMEVFDYLLQPTVEFVTGIKKQTDGDTYVLVDLKLSYIDKDNVIYCESGELYANETTEQFEKDEYICGSSCFTWFTRVGGKWIMSTAWHFG